MMEPLLIEPTHNSPKIILDQANNKFEISGRSLPENIVVFYNPIREWLNIYAKNPNPETNFEIKLTYYNSATFKVLSGIFQTLSKIYNEGFEVTIYWYHEKEDTEFKEEVDYLFEMVDVPFKYVSY